MDAVKARQNAKDATNQANCKRTITNPRQGINTENVPQEPLQKRKEERKETKYLER